MTVKELLKRKIDWQKTSDNAYMFTCMIDGQVFKLRLNDFPEEPLCTIIWDDGEQNLDDLGKEWTLPKHRGE
jgi:hypothetical protein